MVDAGHPSFRCVGGGRSQAVDADPVLGQFHGHRTGEIEQSALGGTVAHVSRFALVSGSGNDVDYVPCQGRRQNVPLGVDVQRNSPS